MTRFEGRRVAVTGAGGFIGGAVAAALAEEGAAVIAIDVSGPALGRLGSRIETAAADVTDTGALRGLLRHVDLAVHAAALVREWGPMEDFVRINVGGTASVLDAAAAAGVERVVQMSSVVVFGYDAPREQDDDAHLRCCGIPYIDTKAASDRLARRRGAVVVRPGDVYGPGSIPWTVRPLELARAGQLAVPGEGRGLMLPLYVDDLVEAVLLAGLSGEPGRAYTAWDGVPVSFGEYFDRIAAIAGARPARRLPGAVLRAAGGAMEAWGRLRRRPPALGSRSATFIERRGTVSTARIRAELGWEPRVALDEGLARTASWARARGLLAD